MKVFDGLKVEDITRFLHLLPHPEGGFYCETFRDESLINGRAASTAIYYLLPAGQISAWHRVDATEVWHYYAGAPLELEIVVEQSADRTIHRLGCALSEGERPQAVVPAHAWQSARSLGDWTLVGCTVAPGFVFSCFEIAAPGQF